MKNHQKETKKPFHSVFTILATTLILLIISTATGTAQVPHLLSYQGHVTNPGPGNPQPFTGNGQFRFALISGDKTLWTNDGSAPQNGQPTQAVTIPVQDGFFSILLGNTELTHMTSLTPDLFLSEEPVFLRVWFDDSIHGIQELTPAQQLSSVAYAMVAERVTNGSIDSDQMANNSVIGSKIAPNSISSTHLATSAITSTKLAPDSVTTSKIAANAVTADKLANNSVGSDQLQSAITLGQGGVTIDYNGTTLAEYRGYGLTSGGYLGLNDKNGTRSISMTTRSLAVKTPTGVNNAARMYHSNGGVLDLGNVNGSTQVRIKGDGTGDSGEMTLYDKFGNDAIKIKANNGSSIFSGPELTIASGSLDPALRLSGALGGSVQLYDIDGSQSVSITGIGGRITTKVLEITGGSDLSESFDINAETETVKPGTLVCVDANDPGKLVPSTKAYDSTVAGIVSGAGGVNTGMVMGQAGSIANGQYPVALTGRVYCLADASQGAIQPGDLITTSHRPGHGMKATDRDRAQGAIIGKAMSSLPSGQGLVLILVSLQ